MISLAYIREWRQNVPWLRNDQVEQDLIICRALVEIFTHPNLKEHLAFRGETALFNSICRRSAIPRTSTWCRCTRDPSAR